MASVTQGLSLGHIATRCVCCGHEHLHASPAVLMPFVAKRVLDQDPVDITDEWGLRDLQQGMAYTLCRTLQCQQCAMVFLDYRFSDEQMGKLYRGYRDAHYNAQRQYYEPGYEQVVEFYTQRENYIYDVEGWLDSYIPECPKVLDWGGGSGANTPYLENSRLVHVHDISGVELVEKAERFVPGLLAGDDYDLVVCSQVLEHVPFPEQLIAEIKPVLGHRTYLYLEVPYESLMREPGVVTCGSRKRHWHEHINFFTPQALRELLDRSGLELVAEHVLEVELGWRTGCIMGVLARRRTADERG